MLESLCGNKNVQRILLFLFVNTRCYGTQLHRALNTPLTPIQKALNRLEKGGVIQSYYEGKTRLYQFNPAYPLLEELEPLLKKAYTLLSAQEKKNYYVVRREVFPESFELQKRTQALLALWNRLPNVKQLLFHAKTRGQQKRGWNGKGEGEVVVVRDNDKTILFQEKGIWEGEQEGKVEFSNTFRWKLDIQTGVISLEHLRRGVDHPVFLFHLAPAGPHSFRSVDAHLCGGDAYYGQVYLDGNRFRLQWRIIGPCKNEEIDYYYS